MGWNNERVSETYVVKMRSGTFKLLYKTRGGKYYMGKANGTLIEVPQYKLELYLKQLQKNGEVKKENG